MKKRELLTIQQVANIYKEYGQFLATIYLEREVNIR